MHIGWINTALELELVCGFKIASIHSQIVFFILRCATCALIRFPRVPRQGWGGGGTSDFPQCICICFRPQFERLVMMSVISKAE